jgi:hypothetical protein
MSVAHQLLFGYDDGHRLLSGSRELGPDAMVLLLGATDAATSADSGPLVTGLRLADDEYALCVTWSAPEAPRPGAVWGHALVVETAALRDSAACEALTHLPRRPSADAADLALYSTPVTLDPATPEGYPAPALEPRDRELLERLVAAAYGPRSEGIVVHGDLGAAAMALLVLWRAQWPELRATFAFRTRAVVRREASDFNLTVAAKVRGLDEDPLPSAGAPAPPWVRALAHDLLSGGHGPLREFLWTFGPAEPPEPRSVRRLTKLWLRVAAADASRTRAQLERHWPTPRAGAALKQALFGRGNDHWWQLDERTRVKALMAAAQPAWDLGELELEARARALALI